MNLDQLDQVAHLLAYPIGAGILVNGFEEICVDVNYFVRGLHRRKRRAIPLAELRAAPPKRIAIMVAAWQEAEVIEQMLEHNLQSLDYDRHLYDIFVGTYCNDLETQQKVDLVARRARNVHKIVVPHDGPTCKADCLNWIYQGIVLDERRTGRRYDILLMHDAEDVIHPLALRLYSHLIPAHDFVQTPVFSLPLPKHKLVAGTYIDEFAEHHLKDMLVREAIGGLVPSAGVGSGFARDAFEEIAGAHGQKPFNPESLTEDYEIGLKFRLAGKKVHFALHTVEREVETPGLLGGVRTKIEEEYIATREYFPGSGRGFHTAALALDPGHLPADLGTARLAGPGGGALQPLPRPQGAADQRPAHGCVPAPGLFRRAHPGLRRWGLPLDAATGWRRRAPRWSSSCPSTCSFSPGAAP